jgi:hypothetical protein
MGLFYRQPALVDQAWDGPKGIQFLMQHGFTDEGLWLEGSIPYQLAATTPLIKAAELLENADYPRKLYDDESGDGHALRGAYDALLPLLLPDQTLPTIGDCHGQRRHLGARSDWEILYRRFRVDLLTRDPQEIVACGFPRDERDESQVIPMQIFRSKQAQAWYAAVYRCGKNVDEPLDVKVMPGELQNWRIEIELAGRRYVHRIPQL